MSVQLLQTKLFTPPPHPNRVPRSRLIQRLDEGLRLGHRLTLVSAPAGSGKTTLLSEWAARIRGRTAWLSLDNADNDPVRFWTYLIAALQAAHSLGWDALQLLQAPQAPSAPAILTPLLNDIAALPGSVVLILDDYHAIATQAIHDGLAFLLDHQPQQLHLVLSTRADPPLPVVRLRARGQLTELRADDLRFTADEAAAFLNEMMNLDLAPEDVTALETRTEGWIVGLQLAALSMQGRADRREFIAAFTGGHHYVLEYLTEEVLARQPAPVQRFLMQTSVLERLCGSLCDAVTGEDGGDATLAHLQRRNLFIVPLDDEHHWYRYHHLFADLLRQRLGQAMPPEQVCELHRRASAWYEREGSLEEAVRHALAAEDFERVAQLAEGAARASRLDSRLTTLLQWVDALPDDVLGAHPRLCIYQAWARFLNGQLDLAQRALGDSRRALESLSPTPENAALRDELTTLLDIIEMIARGLIHSVDGKIEEAIQTCRAARELALEAGHVFLAAHATEGLALAQYHQGHLRQSAQLCRQVIELAERGLGVAQVPLAAAGYVELAGVHLEWNELDAVADCLNKAIVLCQRVGVTQTLTEAYTVQSRLRQALGDIDGAFDALRVARQSGYATDAYSIANFRLATQQARLALARGRVAEVERWVQRMEAALTVEKIGRPLLVAFRETLHTILARAYLQQGEAGQAIAVLDPLYGPAEAAGSFGRVIEIGLLKALALQAQGKSSEAVASLKRSLTLAEPEGYVRLFLDEGAPAAELLKALQRDPEVPPHVQSYAQKLLEAFGEATEDDRPRVGASTLVEPLTQRELKVLQLINEGYSNRQIAEALVIALNTVKRHTSNLYGKLGVNSRTQAIARARQLGLIPPGPQPLK